MKSLLIRVVGDVEQGKTTLVETLVGLPVKNSFASFRLADGTLANLYDENRWTQGLCDTDISLVVISADRGITSRVQEILRAIELLEVKQIVIAFTRMELVPKAHTDAVEAELRSLFPSLTANVSMIRTSAKTKRGMDALKRALLSCSSRASARNAFLPSRFLINEVVSASSSPQISAILSGVLLQGTLRLNEMLEVVPCRKSGKLRGLLLEGKRVKEVFPGSFVLLTLEGVEAQDIEVGLQLAPAATLKIENEVTATFSPVSDVEVPLEENTSFLLCLGNMEILGRVAFSQENSLLHFVGETPFVAMPEDRFLLLSLPEKVLLGGGVIVDKDNALLISSEKGNATDLIQALLIRSPEGVLKPDLPSQLSLTASQIEEALAVLVSSQKAVMLTEDRLFSPLILEPLRAHIVSRLAAYHANFPSRPGFPREELKAQTSPTLTPEVFGAVLGYFHARGALVSEGATSRLPTFQTQLTERQNALLERILVFLRECGATSPPTHIIAQSVGVLTDAVEDIIKRGIETGKVFRAEEGVFYALETVNEMKKIAEGLMAENGFISVTDFREKMNTNRKFAVLALELLDTLQFTRREGDARLLL